MKILLVDDNKDRMKKMIDYLCGIERIDRSSIVDKSCFHDAREFLRSEQVDLLVLDILLPNRAEDDPSTDHSLALLTELSETNKLVKPRKVVGLTAYSEVAKIASKTFFDQTWTILESSEVSDAWLCSLGKCVQYLVSQNGRQAKREFEIDILLITALRDPEMAAVRNLNWEWLPEEPIDDSTFISRGTIDIGGRKLSVVSSVADRMGMVSTAVLASKLISRFVPRICIMPGICAGVRAKAAIGDVIFADSCWDYQSGKYMVNEARVSGFEMDPHHISAPRSVKSRIELLALDGDFLNSIWRAWPNRVANPPKILIGPVASGSAVLADSAVTERIMVQQRKVRGIEMELYGLYLAAEQCPSPKPLTFGIKAVCDFADQDKGDDHQEYAAYISAKATEEFVKRFGIDLIDQL